MSDLTATAKRLIAKHGRTVTLYKINRATLQDDKPWRGGGTSNIDPNDSEKIITKAAFVPLNSLNELGFTGINTDAMPGVEKVALVAGDVDISYYDMLLDSDDELQWKINKSLLLQPGTKKYLYALGLAK